MPELPCPGQRIAVVGNAGAGKSTMAMRLSSLLDLPHVELDALHWGPDWTPREEFRDLVTAAVAGERWVTDGNYGQVRDIVWPRADTIVWMDYPLAVSMPRLIRRTTRRMITREELWNGNREPLGEMFTRKSLIWYALTTHRRRRGDNEAALRAPEHAHLTVVHLRSQKRSDAWLAEISAMRASP